MRRQFTTVRNSALALSLTLAGCVSSETPSKPCAPIELPDLPDDCAHGTVLPPPPPRVRTVEAVVAYANRAVEVAKDNAWDLSLCARRYRALHEWAELVAKSH